MRADSICEATAQDHLNTDMETADFNQALEKDQIMTIFEFCERYQISRTKARKIEKENPRWFDEEPGALAIMRSTLANGDALTAAQLCELVDNPCLLLDLGRHANRAEEQIGALGNVKAEAAPKLVAAYVSDAAKNDPESVDVLLVWLRDVIPAKPVGHAYIAVRLLLGLAPNIRQYDVPRIPRALLNCRLRPEFAGWWRAEKRTSRNVTIYQRPTKIEYDL